MIFVWLVFDGFWLDLVGFGGFFGFVFGKSCLVKKCTASTVTFINVPIWLELENIKKTLGKHP